jgi:D-sedoheptulose 7-phosphate isomerase
MITDRDLDGYFSTLARVARNAEATDFVSDNVPLASAVAWVQTIARRTHEGSNKLMFVGNGGSAAIASHMAIDYSKNGGLRSLAFNDGAALTCLGNDLGYENVFAHQVDLHGREGDLLIAISSSGNSANILNAVAAGRVRGCAVVTLSGFSRDNALRKLGDMNFYVADNNYGFVEVAHLAICHAILDMAMGWRAVDVDAASEEAA